MMPDLEIDHIVLGPTGKVAGVINVYFRGPQYMGHTMTGALNEFNEKVEAWCEEFAEDHVWVKAVSIYDYHLYFYSKKDLALFKLQYC